jgi:hypothetical protein
MKMPWLFFIVFLVALTDACSTLSASDPVRGPNVLSAATKEWRPIKVDLGYGTLDPVPPAASNSLGRIAVARFDDARSADFATGSEIGQVRDLYGVPIKKIDGKQDPVLWVTHGMARALSAEGFSVEEVESPATAGSLPTVVGSVTKVFVDTYMTETAWVDADVTVTRDNVRLFSTSCSGQATQTAWWGSEEEYRSILALAMDDFLKVCTMKIMPTLREPTTQ